MDQKQDQPSDKVEPEFKFLNWVDVDSALSTLAMILPRDIIVWPVPRGGLIVAGALSYQRPDIKIRMEDCPYAADFIIDDIVDSGTTSKAWMKLGCPIITVFCRNGGLVECERDWEPMYVGQQVNHTAYVVFPWEQNYRLEKKKYLERIKNEK